MNEEDIIEIVDEIVDDLDPDRIERESNRLGIAPTELLDRIVVEARARLSQP